MTIKKALTALLATFIMGSMLECGYDGGGNSPSSKSQYFLESINPNSTTRQVNPLMGNWVSGEYNLTFKSDNTYACSLYRDGTSEIRGTVIISGNAIIFSESGDSNSSRQNDSCIIISGPYTFSISGNTLTFSPVLSLCRGEENILCLSYQKK